MIVDSETKISVIKTFFSLHGELDSMRKAGLSALNVLSIKSKKR